MSTCPHACTKRKEGPVRANTPKLNLICTLSAPKSIPTLKYATIHTLTVSIHAIVSLRYPCLS